MNNSSYAQTKKTSMNIASRLISGSERYLSNQYYWIGVSIENMASVWSSIKLVVPIAIM
ncbi:hypothetical protein SAMN02910371_03145 [Butyrivibrio sp. INlla14]|nr:hypothetical protein SAMN02910371_03145 [Butyrivibrio sp. INlla14]